MLKFPDDFIYVEKEGKYTARSDLTLSGWCEPKCFEATSTPCDNSK